MFHATLLHHRRFAALRALPSSGALMVLGSSRACSAYRCEYDYQVSQTHAADPLLDAAMGSLDLLRVLIEHMPAPVAILDSGMRYLAATRRWAEDLGLATSDLIGRSHYDLFPEILKMPRWLAIHQRCLAGATERGEADAFPRLNGTTDFVNWEVRPWRRADGSIGGIIIFGETITARVGLERANRQLAEANAEITRLYEEARERDQLKTQLFANVSHELRTPLTLILGPVERLLEDDALGQGVRQQLAVVQHNARALLKQVNDLLDVSRLDEGKMHLGYAAVDFGDLARATAAQFSAVVEARRIALSVDVGGPGVSGHADPDKIERVLTNLLANALKFTPDGGAVRCTIRGEQPGERAPRGQVTIEVADSGPGIAPALREAVFERFRQADGGTARLHGGTGLGLAIVKELVQLHGGRACAGAAPEGGALFTITMPLVAPPAVAVASGGPRVAGLDALATQAMATLSAGGRTAARPPPSSTAGADARPLVLIAEDNPDMSHFLAAVLSAEFRVVTAADGREGLEQARALAPDLIVSDVMMPRFDGLAFLRALRADDRLATTPFILLTARTGQEAMVEGLESGADDYLTKPFSARELAARARTLVDLVRTRREAVRREEETAQLRRALAARDDFLSVASHELRTPLMSLQLNLQLLGKLSASANQQVLNRLSLATKGCKQLGALIEQLLDVGRATRGHLELDPVPLDISELLRDLADRFQSELALSGCALALRLSGPAPGRWDKLRLEQVLTNLLANAIKFGAGRPIEIDCVTDEEAVHVTIRDHGPGIAPSDQERIFRRFEQAQPARHYGGLGLGLWIADQIVRGHAGSLRVQSQPGEGAAFIVDLPRAPRGGN